MFLLPIHEVHRLRPDMRYLDTVAAEGVKAEKGAKADKDDREDADARFGAPIQVQVRFIRDRVKITFLSSVYAIFIFLGSRVVRGDLCRRR